AHRFSARLVREAQALARLSHPNVVQVYEVGNHQGRTFVAMEHVPGVTLRQWQAQPRPWRECVEVYVQAGRGLAAAHAKGLVHRDFKPSNCILDRQGRVRVLDFGLVREVDVPAGGSLAGDSLPGAWLDVPFSSESTTSVGTIMGTLAYMSPEQLRAESADARADQFCFCVALYEALYGERPFSGSTPGSRSMAIERGCLEVRREVRLEVRPEADPVPSRLRDAVLRGLAYRPEDRWASMDALLSELEDIIASPGVVGAGWMGRLGRLMVAAAIAIGMGGAGSTALDGVEPIDGTEDQARSGA
ncbi:MAG: serine/threonine-protein kinase, partial [Myxococcota bacterium]